MGDMTKRPRERATVIREDWHRPIVVETRDASFAALIAVGELIRDGSADVPIRQGARYLKSFLADLHAPGIPMAEDRIQALDTALAAAPTETLRSLSARLVARRDDAARALAAWDNRSEAA